MPKGYWVGHITITDPGVYWEYAAANQAAFKKYGARFIVRGGKAFAGFPNAKHEVVSGKMRDRACGDRVRRLRSGARLP